METIRISRTRGKDLEFTGEKLAGVSGRWAHGQEQNRWTDLSLYRAEGGKYVVVNRYVTWWEGEESTTRATVCDTARAVYDLLTDGGKEDLGRLDKELLELAAKEDAAFAEFLVERI